jgi:hypothetical protein
MSKLIRLVKPSLSPEQAKEISDISWLSSGDVYTISIQGPGGQGICFGGQLAADFADLISRSADLALAGNCTLGVPEAA